MLVRRGPKCSLHASGFGGLHACLHKGLAWQWFPGEWDLVPGFLVPPSTVQGSVTCWVTACNSSAVWGPGTE